MLPVDKVGLNVLRVLLLPAVKQSPPVRLKVCVGLAAHQGVALGGGWGTVVEGWW